ncbi:MAG: hypothetical protein ABIG92_03740 [Candidatus Omnitrophota bacterium]
MAKRLVSKKLGELLIERNVITKKQLEKALEIHEKKGGLTGEILVELGYATEEAIAQALTAQYGFPFLPLDNYEINPEILKILPKNVAVRFCMIPIDKIGNNLTVAMSNPLNTVAIEDVELISGLCVQIFVSTSVDVKKAIEKYYK